MIILEYHILGCKGAKKMLFIPFQTSVLLIGLKKSDSGIPVVSE